MTKVAILWHMHQPYYEDPMTGQHVLPWVRLHALKDYFGMVALTEEFPTLRLTFNLVPSLLVQLEAFAGNRARDRHLDLGLKPADQLTPDERDFIVSNFFHAHRSRMIDPYPRYRHLLEKKQAGMPDPFTIEELRDLQVWHKLVWIDASYLERDSRCRALLDKGAGFVEEDKAILRQVELEVLGRVIPEYRRAAARGQVELSTSPFYHPILPLLCDTHVYLRTHPHSPMPRHRFMHPEDAREQLARAVSCHERLFGDRPRGLWPSEGSVSDAVVDLAADAGFEWMATDELILSRTLGIGWGRDGAAQVDRPDVLYRPYRARAGSRDVACAFRDHTLSDLIGFTYAGWDGEAAAADFCDRVKAAGLRFSQVTQGEEAVVFVILDGENAWEHYPGSGRPFLRALYRRLSEDAELTTVTMGDACRGATERLSSLFPGSWIDGNFYVWIGHADDHRAWDQLAEARTQLEEAGTAGAGVDEARHELLIAEGSDWFWWYGDDHSSEHDQVFDDLFRRHVRNVYRRLGRPIPEGLFETNITTAPTLAPWSMPISLLSPIVDGEPTSYFEWLGAGVFEPRGIAGAMHRVSHGAEDLVRAIHFGFNLERLHVRVDMRRRADEVLAEGMGLVVRWLRPAGYRLRVRAEGGRMLCTLATPAGEGAEVGVTAAAGAIAELSVPFALLGLTGGQAMAFVVALEMDEIEIAHYPVFRPIELDVPEAGFDREHWTA
jgi:alpha-amylase/alpha-mannosidase (GH57 family)